MEGAWFPEYLLALWLKIISGFSMSTKICVFIPPLQRSWKGVYWFHLVHLSICGQNHVRSVSSTILVGSISYLHILSSNFRRCVACNVYSKIKKLSSSYLGSNLIQNFYFVCFLLGIQFDSIVRVIMRRRGISSERRRSSCSSVFISKYITCCFSC